jgi:hypothetical protein
MKDYKLYFSPNSSDPRIEHVSILFDFDLISLHAGCFSGFSWVFPGRLLNKYTNTSEVMSK